MAKMDLLVLSSFKTVVSMKELGPLVSPNHTPKQYQVCGFLASVFGEVVMGHVRILFFTGGCWISAGFILAS